MSRKVIVTGATGFSGRFLVDYLVKEVSDVECVGIGREPVDNLPIEFKTADLLDREYLLSIIKSVQPSLIFHLAGAMPPVPLGAMWESNVGGTACLFDAVARAGLKPRVLVVGSAAEYQAGNTDVVDERSATGGESDYGLTKHAQVTIAEAMANQHNFDLVIARTFNLVGPGLPSTFVAGKLCAQAVRAGREGHVKVGRTDAVRDFVDVRDAVRAYVDLALDERQTGVYNVCSGEGTSIEQLLSLVLRKVGIDEYSVVRENQHRGGDVSRMVGSNRKIVEAVDWRPTISIEDSLSDMLAAYGG